MWLRRQEISTEQERAVVVELDGPDWLLLRQEIAGHPAEDVLRWHVEGPRLTQWWSREAEVLLRVGGCYKLRWPTMGWVLTGQIVDITPVSLVISWVWSHEPDLPARGLTVRATSSARGTSLWITQGPQPGRRIPQRGCRPGDLS